MSEDRESLIPFFGIDRRGWRQQAEAREQERARLDALFPPLSVTICVRAEEDAAIDVEAARLWLEANSAACGLGTRDPVELERAKRHFTIARARHALASMRAELQRAGVRWEDLAEVTPMEEGDYLDLSD